MRDPSWVDYVEGSKIIEVAYWSEPCYESATVPCKIRYCTEATLPRPRCTHTGVRGMHRRKHTTCEAGDCAVHTYSVTAASSFMGKLQPFSYEARTEAC